MTLQPPTVPLQNMTQPKAVEKATGQLFVLVRDDVAANGKLYIAPVGMLTSMRSIRPEVFREEFEWYVAPADRPLPVREVSANDTQQQPVTPEGVEAGWPEGTTVDDPVEAAVVEPEPTAPKKRGRPKGSKNKKRSRKRPLAKGQ